MSRPVRNRRSPKKFDPESFVSTSKATVTEKKTRPAPKRTPTGRETKKKEASDTKRSLDSSRESDIGNQTSKSKKEDTGAEVKKTIRSTGARIQSSKLQAEKTRNSGDKEDSNLGENEKLKREIPESSKGNRLRMKNESQKNDSGDRKRDNSNQARSKSTDAPQMEAVETQNKFFKTKKLAYGSKPTIISKEKAVTKKKIDRYVTKKESVRVAPALRQTTLSESFRRSSLRTRLRPRKISTDYKDSSSITLLLENSISPEKRNSFVSLERLAAPTASKAPVYKAVKLRDKSTEDKDSVYDFQIDENDPGEKAAKNKKKKRAPRKPGPNKKKKTNVAAKIIPKTNTEASKKPNKADENTANVAKAEKIPEGVEKLDSPRELGIENKADIQPEKLSEPQAETVSSQNLPPKENSKVRSPRIIISSVETLTGDRKVSFKTSVSTSRQTSAKFNPFRSTHSIFKPRPTLNVKDMMEHSLLNRSLSPIKNNLDHFDPASPWRPPLTNTFFSVKQIVQSTPQVKRTFGRSTQRFRIDEKDENDENAESGALIKRADKKPATPLGIKIMNAENIQASNARKNEPLLPLEAVAGTSGLGKGKMPLGLASNYGENRVNPGFGDRLYKSPKKNDKATTSLGSPGFKKRSNLIASRGETDEVSSQKKDSDTQDDENSPPIDEPKLLKQSNLNTFLNLDEMPESSMISTSHGIFGDSFLTPTVTSHVPKLQSQANIETCFGFDENNSDIQVSPVKPDKKQAAVPVKKIFDRLKRRVVPTENKTTARISLGEIKNTLYPRKEKKEENNKKTEAVLEAIKDTRTQKNDPKSNKVLNPLQFSDTFDIISESELGEGPDKSLGAEIALFADLEPVHFTKPPRFSYTKKRERRPQYLSSDEENTDDEYRDVPVPKKRKIRVNKVEEKKIDEWVKSVNETFQEIDDFDLVVEKLP